MQNELLKTLWMLRFQKLKKNEEAAAWKYQEILNLCLMDFRKDEVIINSLSQLVGEERSHEQLADELIRIVYQNHPECGILST